jgi:hypothetical protein
MTSALMTSRLSSAIQIFLNTDSQIINCDCSIVATRMYFLVIGSYYDSLLSLNWVEWLSKRVWTKARKSQLPLITIRPSILISKFWSSLILSNHIEEIMCWLGKSSEISAREIWGKAYQILVS